MPTAFSNDVVEALVGQGYKKQDAVKAVQQAENETPARSNFESLFRTAIQFLQKPKAQLLQQQQPKQQPQQPQQPEQTPNPEKGEWKEEGQTVYVLMSLEGTGKVREWRPVAVVSNPDLANQWYEYGKNVDWVPLELDAVKNISPENMPSFHPRKTTPTEEKTLEVSKQMEATINRMQKIIDDQQAVIKKLQRGQQVKSSADKMPPKPQGFADVLNDAQEIADYVETYAVYPVDNEFVAEQFRGQHAVLKLMPMSELKEAGRDHNLRSKKNEDKYLKQNLKTQPPALVVNGEIMDGNHRYRANKRRGLTHMWCYVVMDGEEVPAEEAGSYEKRLKETLESERW
jgi:hypothetical protein